MTTIADEEKAEQARREMEEKEKEKEEKKRLAEEKKKQLAEEKNVVKRGGSLILQEMSNRVRIEARGY